MALTITSGYSHSSGGLVTPTRLNTAITGLTVNMAAKRLLGTTTAGAADEVAYTDAGLALLQGTDKAAQRTSLGLFASSLESSITGGIQTGASGVDLIYTSGPSVDLTAGTWLVWGAAAMRTTDTAGEFWLGFRNTSDGTDFGKGSTCKNESLGIIHSVGCFGIVTVAATKTVRLKGFISGGHTLEMGSTNGVSGVIRAICLSS